MEQDISAGYPTPLESVQCQFQSWRKTKRSPREPIPEKLWAAAVKLRDQYPVSHISRSLRLNHTELKNRISGIRKMTSDKEHSPVFIELDCRPTMSPSECIVEMEDGYGSKMTMIFKGQAGIDLLELGKAFWRKDK